MVENSLSTKTVSQNDIDYAEYIVYYKKMNKTCDELLKICNTSCSDFILRDVDVLKKIDFPHWLNGVPLIVRKRDWAIFRGTEAFEEIRAWKESQTQGISSSTTNGFTQDVNPEHFIVGHALENGDDRYIDKPNKRQAKHGDFEEHSQKLEEMIRLRSQITKDHT